MASSKPHPEVSLEELLILARDIKLGLRSQNTLLDLVSEVSAIKEAVPALDKLGLFPEPQLLGVDDECDIVETKLSPRLRNRLLFNAKQAQALLHWPDWTAAAAVRRSRQLLVVERMIADLNCFANAPGAEGCAVDAVSRINSENLLSQALSVIGAKHDLLVSVQQDLEKFEQFALEDDETLVTSKLPTFLNLISHYTFEDTIPAVSLIRVSNACQAVLAEGSLNHDKAWLAAIIGVCASNAPCRDSATALWLVWIKAIRTVVSLLRAECCCDSARGDQHDMPSSLNPEIASEERYRPHPMCAVHRALSLLCIAPFKRNRTYSLYQSECRALVVLGSYLTIYSYFAILKICLESQLCAFSTKSSAFDFVASVLMLPENVSGVILQSLNKILDE